MGKLKHIIGSIIYLYTTTTGGHDDDDYDDYDVCLK